MFAIAIPVPTAQAAAESGATHREYEAAVAETPAERKISPVGVKQNIPGSGSYGEAELW